LAENSQYDTFKGLAFEPDSNASPVVLVVAKPPNVALKPNAESRSEVDRVGRRPAVSGAAAALSGWKT
jgi:hypothetical protein